MTSPSSIRRRRKWRERFGITYRVAAAVIAFVTVATQALVTSKVWTDAPKWTVPSLAIATGLVVLRDNVANVNHRLREPDRMQLRTRAQAAVTAALVSVSEAKGIRPTDLGVSVWLVESVGKIRRHERLERLVRVRFRGPQPSDVYWEKGKGVIGHAWASARPERAATGHLARKYGGLDLTEDQWDALSQQAKQGFTREEFCTTVHKYSEILAVPIKNDHGQVLGIVSMDLTMPPDGSNLVDRLAGADVEEYVSAAADLIAKTIERP